MNMEQGSLCLLERDLDKEIWEAIDWSELSAAYGCRRNIIALKKVARHALEQLETIADDLSLACQYYFHDIIIHDTDNFIHGEKYTKFSIAYATIKGAMLMLQDLRALTKAIACISRLPRNDCLPRELAQLHFKSAHSLLDPNDHFFCILVQDQQERMKNSIVEDRILGQVSEEMRPQLRASLVARGGIKALKIHEETKRLARAFGCLASALNKDQYVKASSNLADTILNQKRSYQRSAAAAIAKDAQRALVAIMAAADRMIFVAADSTIGNTLLTPPEFKGLRCHPEIEKSAALATAFRQNELSAFLRNRTLNDISSSPLPTIFTRGGRLECTCCGQNFNRAFLTRVSQRKICVLCDLHARDSGMCSKKNCPKKAWCIHTKRCLACENHSCEQCGIICADAQDLLAHIEDLPAPVAIFLDFDRTIATTRSGQSPLTSRGKKHTVDPILAALARNHPNVRVVTRNRHRDDIFAFLADNNFPVRDVHIIRKTESKATVVLDQSFHNLRDSNASQQHSIFRDIVFADDDIRELIDPQFEYYNRKEIHLHRILFTRTLQPPTLSLCV
eukprot:CAMPEP_0197319100 /NCGR_PEP_ID=MMETSP0891-20130614/53441_1 /TAXON_ID=44058 ORGANISM="Aureoumbra lagunensis, Strain CCMP1510" /NCGR_SAMPLE_ID=MMETSP0891 /ASSEMBLY_ACC=CAM_ASM_000534 /LENGTH=563 /DNA_ID=CAMNT_0042809865 /DNA_START=193 /DNA_END=1880 /DNA_ORIENTATION=-